MYWPGIKLFVNRSIYLIGLSLCFACFWGCKPDDSIESPGKPNILFVLTDDQRADALGAAGNKYIETPNLDKIASEGILFRNTHIMGANHGAVCGPSRAMLLSGLGLHNIYPELGNITAVQWEADSMLGVFRPYNSALNEVTTFPQLLRKNGYSTFGAGKWHAARKSFVNAFEKGKAVFFGGMANHFNTPFADLNPDGSFSRHQNKGFSTDIITNATINFVEEHAKNGQKKPFLAYVSYTAPHDPRSPAPEYIDFYRENGLPVPQNLKPQHPFGYEGGQVVVKRPNMTIRDEQTGAWPRTPDQIRMQLADYYGLITHIDHSVGRILDRLEELKMMENTIVVFTSDNGLGLGSHGLLGKQSLYEHGTNVPLIISGMDIPENKVNESLISLLDLYPTICDLLGLEPPKNLDGKNLMPLIGGEVEAVRESLFSTYWDFIRAVRKDQWKLITYPLIHHTQLFDLEKDPYELNNLAEHADYKDKVQEMMMLMEKKKREANDHLPMFTERKWPMEYSLEGFERKPDNAQPDYILNKYF